ncbi:MAG: L-lysine 6-transaminase [Myxococcota bacterium]
MKRKPPSPEDALKILDERILVTGKKLVIAVEKSKGLVLFDAWHEREFIDFFSADGFQPLTYNHPRLREKDFIERFLRAATIRLPIDQIYTTEYAHLVKSLSRFALGDKFNRLAFAENQSGAVECALKAAFDWKSQKQIRRGKETKNLSVVSLAGAYHGSSGYALSLSALPSSRIDGFYPLFDFPKIPCPKLSFPVTDNVEKATEKSEMEAINRLKNLLKDTSRTVAGVIVEPIQGRGGDNYFRKEFFEKLYELSRNDDFLLIFDETLTGFGTTGKRWLFEHFEVQPDIAIFGGKAAMAGIAASERLDEVESVFNVPGRLNLDLNLCLATLLYSAEVIEAIEEENLIELTKVRGDELLSRLVSLAEKSPYTSNPRALGALGAIDFTEPRIREKIVNALFEEGLIVAESGDRTLAIRLPLDAKSVEMHRGLDILESVVSGFSE